jgi:predicted GIY-YIG superfamily endonuclease
MKEEMVYLMGRENTDFVKIGITNDVDRRLSQLKEKYKDIEILSIYVCEDRKYSANLEKKLHNLLEHKRIQFEWFILKHEEVMAVHEVIILFHKVRNHKYELRERENTWRNRPDIEKIYIPNWSRENKNKPYFF